MSERPHPGLDRVAYVILYVDDLDRSVHFYRDVIGVALRFADDGFAEFDTHGTRFGLFPRSGLADLLGRAAVSGPAGGPEVPRPDVEVCFVVPDVDHHAERLRAAGAEVLSGPTDRPWGHRTLHLRDPDGHVVELAQEIPRPGPRRRREPIRPTPRPPDRAS
jgi:lactoylglutathione lyase